MNKTLRDELATSLDATLVPTLNNEEAIKIFAREFGLEYDRNDMIKMIQFSFKYQAIMRYKYADEMLLARLKEEVE
jgi:hypothetical protein